MRFPNYSLVPGSGEEFLQQLRQKSIGFSPYVFCEFFQGMNVLQVYGHKSGEFFFGIYDPVGDYIGQLYFGSKFKLEEVAKICQICMPKKFNELSDFVKKNVDVSYYKFDQSQYAFVLEQVLQKVWILLL